MNTELITELEAAATACGKKAAQTENATAALQWTQAALNAAHAVATFENLDRHKVK